MKLLDASGHEIAPIVTSEVLPGYRMAVAQHRRDGSDTPELEALAQLLEFLGYDDDGGAKHPSSRVAFRMLAELALPAETTIDAGGAAAEAELARQVAQQMLHGGALNPRAVAMAVWDAMLDQIRHGLARA